MNIDQTSHLTRLALTPADYQACADIWLEASLLAHDFIPPELWRRNRTAMVETFLPRSQVHIIDQEDRPAAFAALDGPILSALFVKPQFQGRGLGSRLLARLLSLSPQLTLTVYHKNERARSFYRGHGFVVIKSGFCPYSGEVELTMTKKAPAEAGEG